MKFLRKHIYFFLCVFFLAMALFIHQRNPEVNTRKIREMLNLESR
jgi:hypothetical protein